MEIRRVLVRDWKGVRSLDLELGPGVNVVHGPNESGKSSLREALRAAFLLPSSQRGKSGLSEARPWGSTRISPRVEVWFRHQDQDWHLTRVFFSKSGCELVRAGRVIAKDDNVFPTLTKHFGDVGIASLWAVQGDVELAAVSPELRPHLAASEVVSPGTAWLEARIREEFDRYWTEAREAPRKILQEARDELARAEREAGNCAQDLEMAQQVTRSVDAADTRLRAARARLDERERRSIDTRSAKERKLELETRQAAIEAETKGCQDDSRWLSHWDVRWKQFLADWDRARAQEQRVAEARARLGETKSFQALEAAKTELAYLRARIRDSLVERVARLEGPDGPSIQKLEERGRILARLSQISTKGRTMLERLHQRKAQELEESNARRRLTEAEQEAARQAEEAELAHGRAEQVLPGLQTELDSIRSTMKRWTAIRASLLDLRQEVLEHQRRVEIARASVEARPERVPTHILEDRRSYLARRLRTFLEQDLQDLDRPPVAESAPEPAGAASPAIAAPAPPRVQTGSPARTLAWILAAAGLASLLLVPVVGLVLLVLGVILFFVAGASAGIGPGGTSTLPSDIAPDLAAPPPPATQEASRATAAERNALLAELATLAGAGVPLDELRAKVPEVAELDRLDRPGLRQALRDLDVSLVRARDLDRADLEERARREADLRVLLSKNPGGALELQLTTLSECEAGFPLGDGQPVEQDTPPWWAWLESEAGERRFDRFERTQAERVAQAKESAAQARLRRTEVAEAGRRSLEPLRLAARETAARLERTRGTIAALRNEVFELWPEANAWRWATSRTEELRALFSDEDEAHLDEGLRLLDSVRDEALREIEQHLQSSGCQDLEEAKTRLEERERARTRLEQFPEPTPQVAVLRPRIPKEELHRDMSLARLESLAHETQARIGPLEAASKQEYEAQVRQRRELETLLEEAPEKTMLEHWKSLTALVRERPEPPLDLPAEPSPTWMEAHRAQDLVAPRRVALAARRAAISTSQTEIVQEIEKQRRILADSATAEAELAQARNDVDSSLAELQRQIGQHEDLRETYGRMVRARERLTALRRKCLDLETQAAAARILNDAMKGAKGELEKDVVGPLRTRMGERLGRLTAGRYRSAQVDQDFKTPGVFRTDGVTSPVESLSLGTREQLVFVSRLCLAELLSERERHLVIFDDSLVHTDPTRLELACRLLEEASTSIQVLVLTCHFDRFESLWDNAQITQLPPPEASVRGAQDPPRAS